MRGIQLTEEFVSQIVGKPAAKISESTEGGDHTEAHVCPLCESHLEEPISEEKIQEHVDYFLDVINENFDIVGEELNEEEEMEDEGDEELDESGELGEDEEDEDGEDVDEAVCSSGMMKKKKNKKGY
jgi:hypothetical protein